MKLTLTQLKRITDLELDPKTNPKVVIPFYPVDDHRMNFLRPGGSELITPYLVTLEYNYQLKEWETSLEL